MLLFKKSRVFNFTKSYYSNNNVDNFSRDTNHPQNDEIIIITPSEFSTFTLKHFL